MYVCTYVFFYTLQKKFSLTAVIICLITCNLSFVTIFCGCCFCLLELQYITMLLLVKLFSCWVTCEIDLLLWVLALRQLRRGSSVGQESNPGLAGD
jgi:hypothetical protein